MKRTKIDNITLMRYADNQLSAVDMIYIKEKVKENPDYQEIVRVMRLSHQLMGDLKKRDQKILEFLYRKEIVIPKRIKKLLKKYKER